MSELEKIQKLLAEKIAKHFEFSKLSVACESFVDNLPQKATAQILVLKPQPTTAIECANAVIFDNVEILVKIKIPYAEHKLKSALFYCEKLCKYLHNLRISTAVNIGKILIAKNSPITWNKESNNTEVCIIKFIINGVKI